MKATELITVLQDIIDTKGDIVINIRNGEEIEEVEGVTYLQSDSGEKVILVSINQ